ncbi:ATP-binding protein [Streptomyces sp. NPDC089919]|uniref:ATP-binding protein n=1 Tax=Streptomyces sp. NPDC089919 TaxID=3155188 RepID=UPI00343284E0
MTETVVHRWRREPRSVPRARAELRSTLTTWQLSALEDAATLLLSELVTNAVRHAVAPGDRHLETRFTRLPAGIRIEVHDACPAHPQAQPLVPEPTQDAGRGLFIVSSLADRWAVATREGVGKRVWAELSLPAEPGGRRVR